MSRSPKLQRLTTMAVPALLAANAMVLVLGLADITGITDDAPAGAESVTYIKAPDGSLTLVDPNTPEGQKAIADAEQYGQQVVTVAEEDAPPALQQQKAPGTTVVPNAVDGLLDDTESTIVDTIDKVGDTIDGVVDGATDIIDNNAGTDVGSTVDPEVDELTDTLTTTVSTVVSETRNTATTVAEPVDEVVDEVVDTVTTVVPVPVAPASGSSTTEPLPVPTTLPDLGL